MEWVTEGSQLLYNAMISKNSQTHGRATWCFCCKICISEFKISRIMTLLKSCIAKRHSTHLIVMYSVWSESPKEANYFTMPWYRRTHRLTGVPPGVFAAIFALQSLRYHDIIKELYPFYIPIVLCKLLITLETDLIVLSIHVTSISLDVIFLLV